MFKFNNDITLLLIGYISLFKHEVQVMRQCIMFPLLTPKAICDDKLKSRQKQCPPNLTSISKLWKYDTYYKVKNICLQNKSFGKVYMNKKWGNCEINLQKLKSVISFDFPRKRLILPNQSSNKGHYWRIMGNETLIKINKSKTNWTSWIEAKVAQSLMVWTLRGSMPMPFPDMM